MTLRYPDGETVVAFDQVEAENPITGTRYDGVVTGIHPHAGRVKVRFRAFLSVVMRLHPECQLCDVPYYEYSP